MATNGDRNLAIDSLSMPDGARSLWGATATSRLSTREELNASRT